MIKTLIIIFGLLLTICSCNVKSEKPTEIKKPSKLAVAKSIPQEISIPSLLVFGLPNPEDEERYIVAGLYHFRYRIMGGCIIPDSLHNSIEINNKITDSILNARLGKNWNLKFENSVDSLYSIDTISINIARKNSYVSHYLKQEMNNKKNWCYYPNDPTYSSHQTFDKNIRVITIESFGRVNKINCMISYLRATVNLNTKKVVNIDKTPYIIH